MSPKQNLSSCSSPDLMIDITVGIKYENNSVMLNGVEFHEGQYFVKDEKRFACNEPNDIIGVPLKFIILPKSKLEQFMYGFFFTHSNKF